jgi:hypothetical protein
VLQPGYAIASKWPLGFTIERGIMRSVPQVQMGTTLRKYRRVTQPKGGIIHQKSVYLSVKNPRSVILSRAFRRRTYRDESDLNATGVALPPEPRCMGRRAAPPAFTT